MTPIKIKPEIIEDFSWGFWIRENFAFMNEAFCELTQNFIEEPPGLDVKEWATVILVPLLVPFAYLFGTIVGPALRREDAMEDVKCRSNSVRFHNKKNIKYCKMISMLSSNNESE